MSRLYSESELLKAVQYACGMQKAECYQIAGDDRLEFGQVLDELYKVDPENLIKLTIQDIETHLKEDAG